MAAKLVEIVSQSTQTLFKDSESQYLECDITKKPIQHPSKFSKGQGLWYPILYNPAWPIYIAATKKDQKVPPISKKKSVIKSYALIGMTLSELQRRPIQKTLIFPHRNTDLPFRQSIPKVVKEHVYEPCETFTLTAIEELESKVMFRSILERIPRHNKSDKNAQEVAIRKAFDLGLPYTSDPKLPIKSQRTKRQKSKSKTKEKLKIEGVDGELLDIIFVDEGLHCGIHGAAINIPLSKNCQIHGNSGIIVEEKKKVLED